MSDVSGSAIVTDGSRLEGMYSDSVIDIHEISKNRHCNFSTNFQRQPEMASFVPYVRLLNSLPLTKGSILSPDADSATSLTFTQSL